MNKTGEIKIDAFGVVTENLKPEALKCDEHYLIQYDYALNKETGVFEVKETGKVDLTEIIQSNKENCGLNLALLNIARGADPSVYADDGKHGGDFSGTTNINEAYQNALNAKEVAKSVAKELGIDDYENCENLDEVIAKAVEKKIAASASAPSEVKEEIK